jgi:hypothetical protein
VLSIPGRFLEEKFPKQPETAGNYQNPTHREDARLSWVYSEMKGLFLLRENRPGRLQS